MPLIQQAARAESVLHEPGADQLLGSTSGDRYHITYQSNQSKSLV